MQSPIPINRRPSTSRVVSHTRRELLASLSKPQQVPRKAAAYAAAVKRHRETIFAEAVHNLNQALLSRA